MERGALEVRGAFLFVSNKGKEMSFLLYDLHLMKL
jgi:hypothetical protein